MKKYLFIILMCLFGLFSCEDYTPNNIQLDQIQSNVENVFGVSFPINQGWATTVPKKINVHVDNNVNFFQILTISRNDSINDIKILNEVNIKENDNTYSVTFDVPLSYDNLLCRFVYNDSSIVYKKFLLTDTDVYSMEMETRAPKYVLDTIPSTTPVISSYSESFANQRGWLPEEVLWQYDYTAITVDDYDDEFKEIFRDIIFEYFPNGRKYNNLPQIKKSGYYNNSAYPITTGDKPIFVTPMYKNDGGYQEITNADLYYYYYKEEYLSKEKIEALPKYKAIQLNDIYTNSDNNRIGKTYSYVLVYWGDGQPQIGTTGSYQFPKGYKIGFMYQSKTTSDNKKKQGELYGDGRLNEHINQWGNFKSSKMDPTDPRMGWMSINKKMFLCIESGTDADFNDLICEVEGGIKPINIVPEYEYNSYVFMFEDRIFGDYDMNDVVIKGQRIDETHVKYTLMASGGTDDIYLLNINGSKINSSTEIHTLFGTEWGRVINVYKSMHAPYVEDMIIVNNDFSFLDATKQPVLYNKTMNIEVYVSRQGEDPHGIMIPYDIRWPLEAVCIKTAYKKFNNWGMGSILDTDWYKYPEEIDVY